MSRIGKKPVSVPAGVTVAVSDRDVSVKGKSGELALTVHPSMSVAWDDGERTLTVSRPDDTRQSRALHGLTRSLIQNMVTGVETPFEKRLTIVGVGYNAKLEGNKLTLSVGFANRITLDVPEGITCTVPSQTSVIVSGPDKHLVGQFAANVRAVRPPEPYKGKGIRYENEHVRRKAGKAFGSK